MAQDILIGIIMTNNLRKWDLIYKENDKNDKICQK